jgi:hypothetical protein
MSFKDLLDKYNSGNASEEEIKLIEEELDKHEAIEDYLSESYNVGLEKDSVQADTNNETTFIKRGVNKKLCKVILASVFIVFFILFSIKYIVSPVVSMGYYNPSEKTVGKGMNDLYFDLKAITELNLPGYAVGSVISEKLGFGEYNIYFERLNLFNRQRDDIEAKIKRNFKVGSYKDFFGSGNSYANSYFAFVDIAQPADSTQPADVMSEFIDIQKEKAISHIKELNSVSYISANMLFKEDLDLEDFQKLKMKYNDKIEFKWLGIRTVGQGKPTYYLSGFNPNYSDGSSSGDSADKNKYPYLQLGDSIRDRSSNVGMSEDSYKRKMVDAYTKHFTSLLRYMSDRGRAVGVLEYNTLKVDYYKNALNYVEKNGLNIYGMLVYGEARELLEFISNEKIKNIEINSVLPSKYIH